jgi:alpha-beta hydrolase superfamily lysophospholipase
MRERPRPSRSCRRLTRRYPGARHEVRKESNRDEVIGHLVAWIERIAP